MKNILLTAAIILFFCVDSSAQSKKMYDEVRADQIYLTTGKIYIKFNAITRGTIIKLLGKPIHIKKEKWETNDATWNRTYTYRYGELVLEDNQLSFIDIVKPGMSFIFKYKTGFTKPLTVGDDIRYLIKLFPNSWRTSDKKAFSVGLTGCDCSLIFELNGGKISKLSFSTDES